MLRSALKRGFSAFNKATTPEGKVVLMAYRRWKKWRARKRMIEEYGDPTAPSPR